MSCGPYCNATFNGLKHSELYLKGCLFIALGKYQHIRWKRFKIFLILTLCQTTKCLAISWGSKRKRIRCNSCWCKLPFVLKTKSRKMENRQKWLKIAKNNKNEMSKMAKNWNFCLSDIFCNYVYQKSPWNEPKMPFLTIFIFLHFPFIFGG